jgi:hypothetical protein
LAKTLAQDRHTRGGSSLLQGGIMRGLSAALMLLDCGDIPYRNFKVLPPDPHRFDRDHDGIGCET